jgi:antiviral helicase SKI2
MWRAEELEIRLASLRHYSSSENLALFPDFQQRLGVLRHLGYVDPAGAVLLKGRVACEMNTCDELLAGEMLFGNVLEALNPPEVAAVLSALVFQEKTQDEVPLTSRMEVARLQTQELLAMLVALQEGKFNMQIDPDLRPSLNWGLAAVVYEWARGAPFTRIADMTAVPEGSIVRCITRLDELCKDFRNAARVIGNPSLYRKMEAASQCIRRDIVFAASLYVS